MTDGGSFCPRRAELGEDLVWIVTRRSSECERGLFR